MTANKPFPKELSEIPDKIFSSDSRRKLALCFETQNVGYSLFRSQTGRFIAFAAYYNKPISVNYDSRPSFLIEPLGDFEQSKCHVITRQIDLLDLMQSSIPLEMRLAKAIDTYGEGHQSSSEDQFKAKDAEVDALFPGLLTAKPAVFNSAYGPLKITCLVQDTLAPDTRPPAVPLDQFLEGLKR
jgi:hypothetical protein